MKKMVLYKLYRSPYSDGKNLEEIRESVAPLGISFEEESLDALRFNQDIISLFEREKGFEWIGEVAEIQSGREFFIQTDYSVSEESYPGEEELKWYEKVVYIDELDIMKL